MIGDLPSTSLIGREGPVAAVADAIRRRRPVAVVGEAGIGKTSVVRAAAALSAVRLHEGGGFATLSWLPYLALRRAVPITDTENPAEIAAAVQQAVGAAALFIDDLQWADEPSRLVVDRLLNRVAVVVAVREGEPDAAATLRRVQDRGALVVPLPGLDPVAALALVARLMPASPEPVQRQVAHAAGGNPLLIEELVAHGEAPSWLIRALGRRRAIVPQRGTRPQALERRLEAIDQQIAAGQLAMAATTSAALLSETIPSAALQRVLASRARALGLLGLIEEAERSFGEASTLATAVQNGHGRVLSAGAETAIWAGRPRLAADRAAGAMATATDDAERVSAALTAAWAAVELGRGPAPIALHLPARSPTAAALELRGLAAMAVGHDVDAADAFDEAASRWAGVNVPRELLCRWAAGESVRRAGDPDAARLRLRPTLDRAAAAGFEPLAARARRSLRLAGERTAAAPASRGGGVLTRREREVLGLVERGLTNAEIARRMSLGRPTVARMLSNAMSKLGADRRAQAVVLAAGMI